MKRILALLIFMVCSLQTIDAQDETANYVRYEQRRTIKTPLYGYKDARTGEIVIPAQYEDTERRFGDGLAAVKQDNRWGYIDGKGNVVIGFQYLWANHFENGLALVGVRRPVTSALKSVLKESQIINKQGNAVNGEVSRIIDKSEFTWLTEDEIAEKMEQSGLIPIVDIAGKYGYMDFSGKTVIPCQFDESGFFHDGLARATKGKQMGYIDMSGEWAFVVEDAVFLACFSEGLAVICDKKKKFGYIDTTGKIVIPCQYESASPFRQGAAAVRKEKKKGKFGYIDKQGNTLLPFEYDGANPFMKNGLAMVVSNKLCGYIDKTGRFVIEPQFSSAGLFDNGLASVAQKTFMALNGYIDTTGELVIPCQYSTTSCFDNTGFALVGEVVGNVSRYFYIDKTGKCVNPAEGRDKETDNSASEAAL